MCAPPGPHSRRAKAFHGQDDVRRTRSPSRAPFCNQRVVHSEVLPRLLVPDVQRVEIIFSW
eukprot:2709227-Heterocapsa_arctica.AAC.1